MSCWRSVLAPIYRMKQALLVLASIFLVSCCPCEPPDASGGGGMSSSVGGGGSGDSVEQCPLLPADCVVALPQEACPFDDWPLVQVRTCAGPGDEGWEVEQWCMKSSVQDVTCGRQPFGGIECCCIDGDCGGEQ